jgi:anthranilate 1,2-dioxygenase large subunit
MTESDMNETIHQPVDGLHSDRLVYFPRADGSRIPFNVYTSPEIYQLEQERIFRGPTWSFVALEVEIPHPNDFKSTFVGDTPVVVTRNEDRSLSAWLTAALIGARWSAAPHAATRKLIFAFIINGATTRAAT